MKKKIEVTLLRERKRWTLTISGNDAQWLKRITDEVEEVAHQYGATIVNIALPWGRPRTIDEGKRLSDEDVAQLKNVLPNDPFTNGGPP